LLEQDRSSGQSVAMHSAGISVGTLCIGTGVGRLAYNLNCAGAGATYTVHRVGHCQGEVGGIATCAVRDIGDAWIVNCPAAVINCPRVGRGSVKTADVGRQAVAA